MCMSEINSQALLKSIGSGAVHLFLWGFFMMIGTDSGSGDSLKKYQLVVTVFFVLLYCFHLIGIWGVRFENNIHSPLMKKIVYVSSRLPVIAGSVVTIFFFLGVFFSLIFNA